MGRHQMTHEGWHELVVVGEGDYVVQYGVRHGQWHGGPSWGSGATGPVLARVRRDVPLRDGRIAERWAVRDDLTMVRQLGGLPSA